MFTSMSGSCEWLCIGSAGESKLNRERRLLSDEQLVEKVQSMASRSSSSAQECPVEEWLLEYWGQDEIVRRSIAGAV